MSEGRLSETLQSLQVRLQNTIKSFKTYAGRQDQSTSTLDASSASSIKISSEKVSSSSNPTQENDKGRELSESELFTTSGLLSTDDNVSGFSLSQYDTTNEDKSRPLNLKTVTFSPQLRYEVHLAEVTNKPINDEKTIFFLPPLPFESKGQNTDNYNTINRNLLLQQSPDSNIYFLDNIRKVDFILVHHSKRSMKTLAKIETFLLHLSLKGIEFEVEECRDNMVFVKLHASQTFLNNIEGELEFEWMYKWPYYYYEKKCMCCFFDTDLTNPIDEDLIDRAPESIKSLKPSRITDAERIMAIYKVMQTAKFGNGSNQFGITNMLQNSLLSTAYPLHDKEWTWNENSKEFLSDRQLLNKFWANFTTLCKVQPKNLLHKYFGPQMAFYFAWFGYYTQMLFFVAILGCLVLIYGICTVNDPDFNRQSYEISRMQYMMCCLLPLTWKRYFLLSDSYDISKINYILDNNLTAIFNIIMAFWGVLFIVKWRQKEQFYKTMWNLSVTQNSKKIRLESQVRSWQHEEYNSKNVCVVWYSTLCLVTTILVLFALQMILLRLILISWWENPKNFILKGDITPITVYARSSASLYASVAVSVFLLLWRSLADYVLSNVAGFLTRFSKPRTENELYNTYISKLFILTFINNFIAPIYLAFFRGAFKTNPHEHYQTGASDEWLLFKNVSRDHCDPSGCTIDLAIYLCTFMIYDCILILLRGLVKAMPKVPFLHLVQPKPKEETWEKDYNLYPFEKYDLIGFYTESVIQYAMVVCFTAACPILPILACFNNILKLKIDAINMIKYMRRPLPVWTTGLGTWNTILITVTCMGILINAMVMGTTTEMVPRTLYMAQHNFSLIGYMESKLTLYTYSPKEKNETHINSCYYVGYRNSNQELSSYHFKLNSIKLYFVLIMENLLFLLIIYIVYKVPRMTQSTDKFFEKQKMEQTINKH